MIRLHLGIMKIFTRRRDDGMSDLIEVLSNKGDRVFSSILRDIPLPERARLSEASHQHGLSLLQSGRNEGSVREAVKCFSIAILFCRETDLVLEGKEASVVCARSSAHLHQFAQTLHLSSGCYSLTRNACSEFGGNLTN